MKNQLLAFLLLVVCLGMASCSLPITDGANPLDQPGPAAEPTVGRLHRANVRAITQNPGYAVYEDMREDWAAMYPADATPCDACGGNGGAHSADSGIPSHTCPVCGGTGQANL